MSLNSTNYNIDLKVLLQAEIRKLESVVNSSLNDSPCQLLTEISKYIIDSGGKRIRPLILLLVAKMFDYKGDEHIKLAAVLEMIHTATLLHDDIIDNSKMRRNKTTAHIKWGVRDCIITGDWLSALSFDLAASTKNFNVIKLIPKMAKNMVNGELQQLRYKNKLDVTVDIYYKIIEAKTGLLFAIAAEIAASIANQPPELIECSRLFGLHLGLAFQIQDDLLDYIGETHAIGKNIGDDLLEGKLTLPMIYLKERQSKKFSYIVKKIKKAHLTEDDFTDLKFWLEDANAINDTRNEVIKQQGKALEYLNLLPSNIYTRYLEDLTNQIVWRSK